MKRLLVGSLAIFLSALSFPAVAQTAPGTAAARAPITCSVLDRLLTGCAFADGAARQRWAGAFNAWQAKAWAEASAIPDPFQRYQAQALVLETAQKLFAGETQERKRALPSAPPQEDGSIVQLPPSIAGQKVYAPSECIGPVIMGECKGSIIPNSAYHQTCYGQMLNGMCTGPMF